MDSINIFHTPIGLRFRGEAHNILKIKNLRLKPNPLWVTSWGNVTDPISASFAKPLTALTPENDIIVLHDNFGEGIELFIFDFEHNKIWPRQPVNAAIHGNTVYLQFAANKGKLFKWQRSSPIISIAKDIFDKIYTPLSPRL